MCQLDVGGTCLAGGLRKRTVQRTTATTLGMTSKRHAIHPRFHHGFRA